MGGGEGERAGTAGNSLFREFSNKRFVAPSLGLLGQVVAILLLALLVEFGASTLLYERASQFSVRDDEARRLAEHLVISARLVDEAPVAERAAMAAGLTTDRYALRWSLQLPRRAPIAPGLDALRRQVIDWEPKLARSELRLRLASPGRGSTMFGALRLADGSWLYFRTLDPFETLNLAPERVALALVPAIALMAIGALLIRRTLLPLRRLAEAADRVGGGDTTPVAEDGPGEVRRVVAAFNRMQGRIHRLIADRTQSLAAVGHDLRTPLARLRLRAEGIEREDVRTAMSADIAEMDAMVASVLAYLGGDSDPERPVRIDLAVMCATVADDAADHGGDVEYRGPDHLECSVRPIGMKRALTNLVGNALHHAGGACIIVEEDGATIVVAVEDSGPGIPEAELARVTEPFVRLDTARGRDTVGFGLGLAIVTQAAEAEGGRLALANRAGGGLRAAIVLPDARTRPPPQT